MSTKAPKSQMRGDAALANFALAQLLDQLLLHLVALFLHGLALGEDQPVAMAVDLDDLERQMGADHAGHLGLLAGFVATTDFGDLRRGHETAHTVQIHQQAALVVIDDLGVDDAVLFVDFLQNAARLSPAARGRWRRPRGPPGSQAGRRR